MVRREISPQARLAGRPIVQARVAATLARLAAAATWRALVRGERLVSSGKLASLSQCVECVVHKRDRQVRAAAVRAWSTTRCAGQKITPGRVA